MYLSTSFHFQPVVFFNLKMLILTAYSWILCFTQSDNIFLFIGVLSLFILNVNNYMVACRLAIFCLFYSCVMSVLLLALPFTKHFLFSGIFSVF